MTHVIVSQGSFDSDDAYDLITSNLTVVNLLRGEGYADALLTPASRASYWVDFYRAQMANGGFAQLVYNSKWTAAVVDEIRAGLVAIGLEEHHALFDELAAVVDQLEPAELTAFLGGDFFGANPVRDRLTSGRYREVDKRQPLFESNHAYLRALPNLRVLSIDDMFTELEGVLGRPIER